MVVIIAVVVVLVVVLIAVGVVVFLFTMRKSTQVYDAKAGQAQATPAGQGVVIQVFQAPSQNAGAGSGVTMAGSTPTALPPEAPLAPQPQEAAPA